MLRSHAALREFTGSREMSVFHTLLAGNIGQPAAPGTVVAGRAAAGGAGVSCWRTETGGGDADADAPGEADSAEAAAGAGGAAAGEAAPGGADVAGPASPTAWAAGCTWLAHAALARPQQVIVISMAVIPDRWPPGCRRRPSTPSILARADRRYPDNGDYARARPR